jgi:hypothetical protein
VTSLKIKLGAFTFFFSPEFEGTRKMFEKFPTVILAIKVRMKNFKIWQSIIYFEINLRREEENIKKVSHHKGD